MVDKIIGHWKLDEESGSSASDSTSNQSHGTVIGTSVEDGLNGKARVFVAGNEDRIEIDNSSDNFSFTDTDFTITAWFKKTTAPGSGAYHAIFSKHDENSSAKSYLLAVDENGYLTFVGSSDGSADTVSIASGSALNDGQWHLATLTRGGVQYRLYVDGVEVDSDLLGPTSLFDNSELVLIGNASVGADHDSAFDGYIDDVRVYNYTLDYKQVSELFYDTDFDPHPPSFIPVVPLDGQIRLFPDTDIVFKFADETPVIDTLNVTIDGFDVLVNGLPEDGYSVFYQDFTDGYTDGYDGYIVTITHDAFLPEGVFLDVEIDATDAYGNFDYLQYQFAVSSTDPPPTFNGFNPLPDSIGHGSGDPIQFQFNDGYFTQLNLVSGADITTLNATIDGDQAIVNGTIQSGFSGSIVPNGFDGFNVSLNKDGGWRDGRKIEVILSGDDLNGSSTVFSYFVNMGGGPVVQPFYPGDGYVAVDRNTQISFEVADASFGIDIADVDISINSVDVLVDDVEQNGYIVQRILLADGYFVNIIGPTLPEFDDVEVIVTATNSVGDQNIFEYSFQTKDETSPLIEPFVPQPNAERVDVNTDISFRILDGYSGINFDTLDVIVDGTDAIVNGVDEPGFSSTVEFIDDGYLVTIDPSTPLDQLSVIQVFVNVSDFQANNTNLTYQFSSDDTLGPVVVDKDPDDGDKKFVNTNILFSLHDTDGSGIIPELLNVTVGGNPAITDGVFQAGYSGSIVSDIVSGYDGYEITIDPDTNFTLGEEIVISIDTKDAYGNQTIENYSFVATELNAPNIVNLSPAPGELASILPEIKIGLHDAGEAGVDLNSVNVWLDGFPAVIDGYIAPNFSGFVEYQLVVGFPGVAILFTPAFELDRGKEYLVEVDAYDVQDNRLLFEYTFITSTDDIKPVFTNFSPEPGETGVSRETGISFSFNDVDGYFGGVNINSLDVVIDGTQAILSGISQNKYIIEYTHNGDGYDVFITPPSHLPEFHNILVELDGYDAYGNFNSTSYSFRTRDISPPVVEEIYPAPGSSGAPFNTDILFDLIDGYSGVDISSVDISVDGKAAVVDGLVLDGYDLGIFEITDGYTFELSGSTLNEGETATIFISGRDNENNSFQFEYSFEVGDLTAPEIDSILPAPFSIGVPNNTDISFDIIDRASGVDLSGLSVTADGDPLVTNGTSAPGITLITTPISGGYRVEIDEIFLNENQEVEIEIDGYDNVGNHVNLAYTLTGAFEVPEITNQVPAPDAAAVPVDATISFDVIDAYGIDIDTLYTYVNGGEAIKDGLEQDGYSIIYTPITNGYNVLITPDDPLPEATIIDIYVSVKDNNGLQGESEYSFKTVTGEIPQFIDISPVPFSVNQDQEEDIRFTIEDPASNGIFLHSIDVYVNFVPVILSGVPQIGDGYSVEIDPNVFVDGYDIVIEHDRFEAYSRVHVSLSANNFDNNNNLFEYYYDVGETAYPDVINQDPAPGATDVPVNTDICFDVVDQSGVDINGLTVTINGQIAFRDGSFIYPFDDVNSEIVGIYDLVFQSFQGTIPIFDPVTFTVPPEPFSEEVFDEELFNDGYVFFDDGYDGYTEFFPELVNDGIVVVDGYIDGYDGYDGYMLDGYEDGYDGYVGIPENLLGYRFCFDSRIDFKPGTVVEVIVHAADLLGNEGDRTYSFTIIEDTGPPAFENVSPFPDEENVALNRPLEFSFVDTFSGAMLNTLDVTLGEANAIVDGEFSDGYTGSIVYTGDGYDVEVFPPGGWPNYATITVSLYGEDCVGNSAQFDFSFLTTDVFAPTFDNIFPAPNTINVPSDTFISFEFNDSSQSGADLNSLNIRILGSLVVIDGNALDGYVLEATPNQYDGYDIQLYLEDDLPEFTEIDIVLSGKDNLGNFGYFEYSWTTADESPPVFENISPIFPGPKVSGNAPIFVDILDYGSGVNANTIGVSVDGISVIDSGITQPNGFVTELLSIDDGYRLYLQSVGPQPHDITGDTAALYRMDSLVLNNVDNATGNSSLDGTAVGPSLVPGKFDSALNFSGGSNRVEIGTDPELELDDITIEAWINPSSLTGNHTIYAYNPRQTITDGRGIFLQVTVTGALRLLLGDGTGVLASVSTGPGLVSTGTYTHVAAVFDQYNGKVSLYVNGLQRVEVDAPVSFIEYSDGAIGLPPSGTVLIGNRINAFSGAFTDAFIGNIDDLRISGAALGKSAIANSYNRSLNVPFSEFTSIPVELFAQDNSGNDGYFEYVFKTLDETPPLFDDFEPAPGEVRVDPKTNIAFTFTDEHSGPDLDTLKVTIDGVVYVEEGLGYNAQITVTPFSDGYGPDGYYVEIDLDTDLPEFKNIIVTLDGYDIDPNQTIVTYQFSTDDLTPPVLVDELPEDGEEQVNPFTDIKFTLHDFNASGVLADSVSVQIDDINAIIDGYAQPGWAVIIDPVFFDGYEGFRYCITPPSRLSLNSNIRVLVDGYDAYGNFFETDFAFTTFDDQDPPQIVNLDPAPDETGVSIYSDINFDIIDGYDVDLSRLDVHVDNIPAVLSGTFQPGFNGPSSGITEIVDGYFVTVDPEDPFDYNQQVTVVIDGYDFSDNHVHFEYYFYTFADVVGPIISNRNPDADEVEVDIITDVEFNITDPGGTGVDMTRLDVHIDSIPVVVDGVIQSGWNGSSSGIESIIDGYHVVIDPTGANAFDYNQIHVVTIDGYDFADNHTNEVYSFATISDPNAPLLSNFDPAPSDVEVPVDTNISFDITDAVSGVDMTRLDVYVNGIPAVTDGIITTPFDDTTAGITTITDGYTVTLDLFVDFGYNELQDVVIDGYDYADNHVHFEYSFLTKVDVDGPTITPIDPLDSVGDYPRTTDIVLSITDQETGVDFSRTDVTIDNVLAMQDGVFIPASGFDGAFSDVIQLIDGYEITFDSTIVFPPRHTVRVVVDGYDYANNQTHFEYIFTTEDDAGPEVFDFSPEPNSIDASNDPVHVMFGIRDIGGGQVRLSSMKIEVAEEADGTFITAYEPINEFQNGWTGNIFNQPPGEDGYYVDMTRTEQGESFALYTFRITASDDLGNTSITTIGKQGGLVDSGTGTVTGAFTLEVGEFFINSNQIDDGDIVLVTGVGALQVDGYTSTEIVFKDNIPAGGTVSFSVYRGSFMLERRIFRAQTAVPTSTKTLDVTYSDPPLVNAAVTDPTYFSISGGDYPIGITSITQSDEDTFEFTFDVPMQALVLYTLTVDSNAILNQIGFSIDDGYEDVTFFGFPDTVGPRVLAATNDPYNINVTVIFNEAMTQNNALTTPGNYLVSHGAYVTAVEADPTQLDRVVLTVENLFGRLEFDVFVSNAVSDVFGNSLDLTYNHGVVRLENTDAALSGLTGRLKSRNAIRRLYEDSANWYLATSGGIEVVGKLDLENKGFVLDGYGFNAITTNSDFIYFGSNDGYQDVYFKDGYTDGYGNTYGDGYDSYGVYKLSFNKLDGNSSNFVENAFSTTTTPSILSNHVNDLFAISSEGVEFVAVATPEGATLVRNETLGINYSAGNDISSIHLDNTGDTLYLANNTLGRVEVYYGVSTDISDRTVPDFYYDIGTSPEISNSTINQIKVTNNTSIIDSGSNTIYVATDYSLTKIETDESAPGTSETGGISFTYGIEGSGAIYEVLGGDVNRVVAVDINLEHRQIFVATDDPSHGGGLTTINIDSNAQFSFASDKRGTLISNDIRDIVFKNL